MTWIDDFTQKLIAGGLATDKTLEGCTENEIAAIESHLNLKLPQAYKDYLSRMGKKAGDFLSECLLTYPEIVEYGRATAEGLVQRTEYKLPKSAFVFVERYGCQFFFFDTASNDDNPSVYRFLEGDQKPEKVANTFSEALEIALSDELADLDPKSTKEHEFTK